MLIEACCAVAAIGLHIGSVHVDQAPWLQQHGVNNTNIGAYVRMESGLTLGTYRNTLSRQSVYAGWTLSHGPFAVTIGGITGYQHRIQPMIVPSVGVRLNEDWNARVAYLPRVQQTGAHVFHLMIERKL